MADIKPALTPEEWRTKNAIIVALNEDGFLVLDLGEFTDAETHDPICHAVDLAGEENRHALAALALYNQPFGFTHEDVGLIRRVAGEAFGRSDSARPLASIASRLSALLPPEKT